MLAPYRTLVLILWGDYSWRDLEGTRLSIATGPASRFLKLSYARLRTHLNWLESKNLIAQLRLEHGKATFNILPFQDSNQGGGLPSPSLTLSGENT
jgi:hypothetical protein